MVGSFLRRSATVLSLKQTNILSAAVVIMATVLLSALLGLVRLRLIATYFGDSRISDIYLAAFRLPDMIFQLLVMGAVSSAFIPVFSSYIGKDDNKTAFFVANTTITASLCIFAVATLLIFIFTKELSRILAPGFSSEEILLMVKLTRLMMAGQIFFIFGNFLTGILQSFHRFLLPALAPITYNIGIIIGTILLSPSLGVYGPTYGVIFGTILFFIIQIPLALRLGWKFQPSLKIKHPGVIEIGKLMLPRTLSLGVSQIEYTADLMIASLFAPGHYTVFTFALSLVSLPIRLFGATIGQASLPTLSQTYAKDQKEEFKKTLIASLGQIIYLVLPASIILLVLRVPLVRLPFGSKSFSWEATLLTGRVVAFLSVAVIAQSLTQLLVRGFYAFHDTKTPFKIGIISVITNVSASIIFALYFKMGVVGLALSSSLSSLTNAILLMYFLNKKIKFISNSLLIGTSNKLLATAIMGLVLYLFMRLLDIFVFDTTRTINLILLTGVTLIIGITTFLVVSRLLKIEETNSFLQIIKRMGRWRQILAGSEVMIESPPTAPSS